MRENIDESIFSFFLWLVVVATQFYLRYRFGNNLSVLLCRCFINLRQVLAQTVVRRFKLLQKVAFGVCQKLRHISYGVQGMKLFYDSRPKLLVNQVKFKQIYAFLDISGVKVGFIYGFGVVD